eukprot:c16991_g1_i2.p1 GENE.c16991_g1_i2~~c16991_g1_i2.p1  ORF type:complete len:664 (+),score=111.49 c16991_g1_i2:37-2028(+)
MVFLAVVWAASLANVCTDGASKIFPIPKSLEKIPYAVGCSVEQNVVFDNSEFVDTNGPRGTVDAAGCCDICAQTDGCNFWSWNLDLVNFPNLPPGQCRWATLSYCCFLHVSDTNRTVSPSFSPNQFNASGNWTSGTIVPATTRGHMVQVADPPIVRTEVSLDASSPIIYSDDRLKGMAGVLSEELFALGGFRFPVTPSGSETSSLGIRLVLAKQRNVSRPEEYYSMTVDASGANITCETPTGCAWGSMTLANAFCVGGIGVEQVAINALHVTDFPDVPYRALLLDLARTQVSVDDIRAAISFCRFYKIRYLHLHFTDDHSWTFPSTAYPKLGSANLGFHGPKPVVYSKQDLIDLVSFADARGVTLVPELEGPGHSAAMRRSDPFFQGSGGITPGEGGVINAASEDVYQAMATLVKEYAEIFKSSPYIHVGCDETSTPPDLPGYDDFVKAHNITSPEDLFNYYVKRMADTVTAVGKQALVWEGAALGRLQPKDAIVLVWLGDSGGAQEAMKRGLQVVNCPAASLNAENEYQRAVDDFTGPLGTMNLPQLPRGEKGWELPGYKPVSNAARLQQAMRRNNNSTRPLNMHRRGLVQDINPLILGAQTHFWEQGWRYLYATFRRSAVARTGGTGWAAATAGRNWTDIDSSFQFIWEKTRSRLWPLDNV